MKIKNGHCHVLIIHVYINRLDCMDFAICSSEIPVVKGRRGGGGGHTGSNNIIMAFSPRNIVGCLLKKSLQRGGGSRAPQDPPSYALGCIMPYSTIMIY